VAAAVHRFVHGHQRIEQLRSQFFVSPYLSPLHPSHSPNSLHDSCEVVPSIFLVECEPDTCWMHETRQTIRDLADRSLCYEGVFKISGAKADRHQGPAQTDIAAKY